MSITKRGPARREIRLYLTIEDLIALSDVDVDANLSVSHVDRAPDSDAAAVRVCLVEESE